MGVVDDARWNFFCRKRDAIAAEQERLKSAWINPAMVTETDAIRILGKPLEHEYTLANLLRRPDVSYDSLLSLTNTEAKITDRAVIEQIEIQAKYQGYIERQHEEVQKSQEAETLPLPAGLDYCQVRGLSKEVQQKLNLHRPETLGQATRISGMTPAAISLLLVHLKRGLVAHNTLAAETPDADLVQSKEQRKSA